LDNSFVDNRRFEQISASLDHITRVFVERSDIFTKSNQDRIKPFGFEGVTQVNVLNWLFEQCTMPQYFYRRKCMEIFLKMLPRENNNKEKFCEENWSVEKILQIGDERTGMKQRPDLKFLQGSTEPVYMETHKWMKNFLRLLDFYNWLLTTNLLPQEKADALLSSSIISTSIEYFLKNVAVSDMNTLVRSIDESLINSTQMSYEAKMHNRNLDKIYVMRNIILIAILDFIEVLMKQHSPKTFLQKNEETLIMLINNLIFTPQTLSFDNKSQHITSDLSVHIVRFIETASTHSAIFHAKLLKVLKETISQNLAHIAQSCDKFLSGSTINEDEENKLKGIEILITNFKMQMNLTQMETMAREVLMQLFNGLTEESMGVKRPRSLKPSVKKFVDKILRVCLRISSFLEELVAFVLDNEPLKVTEACTIARGDNFLQVFKNAVFQTFASNAQNTVALFISQMTDSTPNNLRIFNILAELNEFIYKFQSDSPELLDASIHTMISVWPAIMKAANGMENDLNCVDMAVINLVTHIAMVCPYELHLLGQRLENFQKWLLGVFEKKENSLEIKSKGIFLLPCITHSEDKSNDDLMKALNKIRQFHLPFRSSN
jgi:hypothetical protein